MEFFSRVAQICSLVSQETAYFSCILYEKYFCCFKIYNDNMFALQQFSHLLTILNHYNVIEIEAPILIMCKACISFRLFAKMLMKSFLNCRN